MDELRSVPDGFTFRFPVWVAGGKSTGEAIVWTYTSLDGEVCVPVFTDEDLARRFIEALGGQDLANPEPVPDQAAFVRLLGPFQASNTALVVFDPNPRSEVAEVCVGVGVLLEQLKG